MCCCCVRLLGGDSEVVFDGEDTGDAVGAEVGDVLIHLAGNYAFQADVAVVDDDVNAGDSAERIAVEAGVRVDGAKQGEAQPVIEGRERQDLDFVVDAGDTLDSFDDVFGARFEGGAGDLTEEGDFVAVDLECEVIEDVVEGKGDQFLADFFLHGFGGSGRGAGRSG